MPDLGIELAGVKLKNPFIVASGPVSKTVEQVRTAEQCGAAAVILKTAFFRLPYENQSRFYCDGQKALYCAMDTRLTFPDGMRLVAESKKKVKIPIIASIIGSNDSTEIWAEMAAAMAAAGADMIEANFSCALINAMKSGQTVETDGVVDLTPETMANIITSIRSAVNIPVFAKFSAETPAIPDAVAACLVSGVSALELINSHLVYPGANIYQGGRPVFANLSTVPLSAVYGPTRKPYTLRYVAQTKLRHPNAAIIATGGMTDWQDAIEAIMMGAMAVSFCTGIMWRGWHWFKKLSQGLSRFMEEQGYQRVDEMRGLGLDYYAPQEKVAISAVKAVIQKDKCSHCRKCAKLGHCHAINHDFGEFSVDPENCTGCAVCLAICPSQAIMMAN
jgi:dihydroorotate dehydrogenase/Pyruvate/2-oxoacid:ferredoxin oxidoreductase delta subunit